MNDRINAGASWLMGSLLVGTGLSRWYVLPRRKRRRGRGRHRAAAVPVQAPTPLLRPIEALDRFEAHCPIEHRPTLHIRLRTGCVVCLECRNPGGAP